jgi:hypothetical protein
MKVMLTPAEPEYEMITAHRLLVGQAVRYRAGNFVVRLSHGSYLSVDSNGKDVMVTSLDHKVIGHGVGDLMPKGTSLTFQL